MVRVLDVTRLHNCILLYFYGSGFFILLQFVFVNTKYDNCM